MTNSTTFINRQTPISADWLNDVNNATYSVANNTKLAPYNAKADGTTDDSAAVLSMVNTLGYVVFPAGNTRISSNITLIGLLVFSPGSYLTIDSGINVMIDGMVWSPPQYIFRGTGTVSFGGDPATNTYSEARTAEVQWFGVDPGNGSDQTPALQKAYNAMSTTREGILRAPIGTITMLATCNPTRGVKLIGAGSRRTVFSMCPNGVANFASSADAVWFEGIQFEAPAGTYKNGGLCIDLGGADCQVVDVNIGACTQGIRLTGANSQARNITNIIQPSALVGGSYVVNVRGADSIVRGVNARGSGSLFLESIVRVDTSGTGVSRVMVADIDSTVSSAAAVNIVAVSDNMAQITVDGVQQNGTGSGVVVSNSGTAIVQNIIIRNVQAGPTAAAAVSLSNSGAGSIQKPTIDGVVVYTGATAGIILSQTSGSLQNVKIGICDLSGATTPLSITGTISGLRIDPLAQPIIRTPAQTFSQTIANNGVFTLATATSLFGSQVLVTVNNVEFGQFMMRAASTPAVTAMFAVSTNMASTTGVLTGTTGTSGKFTVSADASGNLYFENRLGASALVQITFMTGIQTPIL